SPIYARQRGRLGGREVFTRQLDAFAVAARVLAMRTEQLAAEKDLPNRRQMARKAPLRHVERQADGPDQQHVEDRSQDVEFEIIGQAEEIFGAAEEIQDGQDRKSTRLNSSHRTISYAVFCLKKKNRTKIDDLL